MGTKRHHSSRESSKKGKKSNGHSSSHTKAKKKAHSSRKNSGIMNHQKVVINQQFHSGNSAGNSGFVLSIISIFFGWIPIIGWILWFLGFLFSVIGLFKKPRGLAIAGTVISLIGIGIISLVITAFGTAFK